MSAARWLLLLAILVVLLTFALILQGVTGSPVAGWSAFGLTLIVLVVRYLF